MIDTHVHLWQPAHFRMPWLDNDALLNHTYLLDTYREHVHALPIDAIVFMECGVEPRYAFLEACWAVQLARQEKWLQGIIAAAPLEFGAQVQTFLEALVKLGPEIKGVRRLLEDEQDPSFCLQPAFLQGVQLATAAGLSVEICIRHWQLPAIIELVRRCPQTNFMLNHMGKPPIRSGKLDTWFRQMHTLGALPNVWCKVSGLLTEANPITWKKEALVPLIRHIWETFGEDRVVFGGDWPVMLSTSTYTRWFEVVQEGAATLSSAAQAKFWHQNARQFYRLNAPSDEEA